MQVHARRTSSCAANYRQPSVESTGAILVQAVSTTHPCRTHLRSLECVSMRFSD